MRAGLSEFWLLWAAEVRGLEVSFRHYRYGTPHYDGGAIVGPYSAHFLKTQGLRFVGQGGLTIATVLKDGKVLTFGNAHCSKSDTFCKATGRLIALRRAMSGALA